MTLGPLAYGSAVAGQTFRQGDGGGGGRREDGLQMFFFRPFGPQFSLKIRGRGEPPSQAPSLDPPLYCFEGGILTQFPAQQVPQTVPQCNSPPTSTHSARTLTFKMANAVDDKELCNNYQKRGGGVGFCRKGGGAECKLIHLDRDVLFIFPNLFPDT